MFLNMVLSSRTRCQYSGSSWGVTGSARLRQRLSVSSLVATSRRHMRSSRTEARSASYVALASASFFSRAASARAAAASGAFGSCSASVHEGGSKLAGNISLVSCLMGHVPQHSVTRSISRRRWASTSSGLPRTDELRTAMRGTLEGHAGTSGGGGL